MYNSGDRVMLISPDGKAQKGIIDIVHDNLRIKTRRGSTYLQEGWRIEPYEDYCYFTSSVEYIQSRQMDRLRLRLLSVGISSDSGAAALFLSFDGETFEQEMISIAPGTSLELPVDVRAIRLEAKDKKKPVKYDINWI